MKKAALSQIPSSVYRLQLSESFPFKKAIACLPYLCKLGIEGIFCSPIFECVSHGYDVANPNRLNPLLGTMQEYDELCLAMQKHGLKQVLDVVPNHMGIKGEHNKWWLDVMQYGPYSSYNGFFDIHWNPDKKSLHNKVLLPILNDAYGRVLENQQIRLYWKDIEGFWVQFDGYHLPVTPHSYPLIFESLQPMHSSSAQEQQSWDESLKICQKLTKIRPEEKGANANYEALKKALIEVYYQSEFCREQIQRNIELFNGKKGDASSFHQLHQLLEKQYYRLAYWMVAGHEINYRRFFNINELVGIHMEKEEVFNEYHRWIFDLIEQDKVQGLRIDHPDGLYDPAEYFERIQTKNPAFVVVEKILNFKEELPENWNVDGTVGYAFLNILNGLFIQKQNGEKFDRIYEKFIGQEIDFKSLLYERKKRFIVLQMASNIDFLGSLLDELSEKNNYYRDFTRADLTHAVLEVMACFPVYRTYITAKESVNNRDRSYVLQAIEMAKMKAPEINTSIFHYLRDVLLLDQEQGSDEEKKMTLDFVLRFQQLTAPVMAKGLEDSVYFIYNRLISLNEVGGYPRNFGYSKADFHQFNRDRLEKWPYGFSATSTHDTKYSEDVRQRINVLSEIPLQWQEHLAEWKIVNKKFKKLVKESLFPEYNTEYYIYQMLIGMWPYLHKEQGSPIFLERLWSCLLKVIREAGTYTSWLCPNEEYEKAVKEFLLNLVTPNSENFFYPSFLTFQRMIALYGRWNSLSQLVLKMGSGGIVDVYQGNEQWNFCLMDPDNRRPLNFDALEQLLLEAIDEAKTGADQLLQDSFYDKIKLYVTSCGLNCRKNNKELFLKGEYEPLHVQDKRQENVVAYIRRLGNSSAICVGARFFSQIATKGQPPLHEKSWGSADLILPEDESFEKREFQDVFTGKCVKVQMKNRQPVLPLADVFQLLPFSILINSEQSK